ncbi:MAG: LysO family transporter [Bacteroidetes bacterium]|uniref:LysO family transporter n=1 Tax=Candidatus Cryptobacteroides merdavium TaxID=2840769 RepID=A0A9D9EF88_9BACT|nr:LysO family transporter [Candidatus Cryptobacteroides merdavium]
MLAGAGLGYQMRNVRLMRKCGTAVSAVIWIMLFSLGLKIGADKELIGNLSGIGLQAFVLAVFGVAGSVIAATIVYKVFFKERQTDSE